MLNELFNIQNRIVSNISLNLKRHIYKEINWKNNYLLLDRR